MADGKIDLTRVAVATPIKLTEWLLDAEHFKQAIETGLNDALAAHDLTPI